MNALQTFSFPTAAGSAPVRIVDIDGNPWFVAADVCRAAGYAIKTDGTVNTTLAVAPLTDDEVSTCRVREKGRPSIIISESGLYKLVMRSDKPEARKFQDWVTRDVLPAIRKDGMYVMGEEKVASGELSIEEMTARVVTYWQDKAKRLQEELAEAAPKVEFFDAYTDAQGLTNTRDLARLIGRGQKELIGMLLSAGVLYRSRGKGAPLKPKEPYRGKGYLAVKTSVVNDRTQHQTLWTPKGVQWAARRWGAKT